MVADDPERACLLYLRALGSHKNIRDLIRQHRPHAERLPDDNVARLSLWLNHSLDYLEAAGDSQSSTKYLITYYGILNLTRFLVSIVKGRLSHATSHGLSRCVVTSLKDYTAEIGRSGSLSELASVQSVKITKIDKQIMLVDILLSDLSSSAMASDALATVPNCMPGIASFDDIKKITVYIRERLKGKEWEEYAPGHYQNKITGEGGALMNYSFQFWPSNEWEWLLFKDRFAKYLNGWVEGVSVLGNLERGRPQDIKVPYTEFQSIDLAYERDGSGYDYASLKLPGLTRWWPVLLRQFTGSWMLADIIRYTPELLVLPSSDVEHQLQIACQLYNMAVVRGFPLLVLQILRQEQIRFSPQTFLG